MRSFIVTGMAGLMFVVLAGCTTYYKVTDPSGGQVFYTTDIDQERSGVVTFTDAKSKQKVTLQSSAIAEISSDEYDKAVGTE